LTLCGSITCGGRNRPNLNLVRNNFTPQHAIAAGNDQTGSHLTEGFIADFLPTPPVVSSILAVERLFGSGQETEDDGRFFISETGFDEQTTELNFAPGIEPAFDISYPLHPSLILP
jgi:hypothetical protein